MKAVKAKGKLRGKQCKPTLRQKQHRAALPGAQQHATGDISELFSVPRSTTNRTLRSAPRSGIASTA